MDGSNRNGSAEERLKKEGLQVGRQVIWTLQQSVVSPGELHQQRHPRNLLAKPGWPCANLEPCRSPLALCQELGQESQLGTAGPAPTGSPLPTTPLQAHHVASLLRQFSFLLCVFLCSWSPALPATFVDQDQVPTTVRKQHRVQWHTLTSH